MNHATAATGVPQSPTQLPKNPDLRILYTLAGLCSHLDKPYCYPSQAKILHLTRRFYGRTMSVRTLNRHLAALVQQGWISRTCRHRLDEQLGWTFRSTLYALSRRTYRALRGLAITTWRATKLKDAETTHKPYATRGRQSDLPDQINRSGVPLRGPPRPTT